MERRREERPSVGGHAAVDLGAADELVKEAEVGAQLGLRLVSRLDDERLHARRHKLHRHHLERRRRVRTLDGETTLGHGAAP